jgi:hypothetical protein
MIGWKKIISYITYAVIVLLCILLLLTIGDKPEKITYGSSFSALYAKELGLNPKEVYIAILDDLNVRKLRLAGYWTSIEPVKDSFNFNELDFQIREAEKRDADIILSVGRRLPRWPECHVPEWAKSLTWEEQKIEIKELITAVVNRYKDNESIKYWQVENEPFLTIFAKEHCGELDKDFLKEEVELVHELDSARQIIVTDSGNLGLWAGAYKTGDAFGTSVYVYFWSPEVGPFKSILPPSFYRIKNNIMRLVYGSKQTFLIELSVEPWLLQPVMDTPIETQLKRMDIEKFEEIIEFAKDTRFDTQYLWGAEWWYWLKLQGKESFWLRAKELYN